MNKLKLTTSIATAALVFSAFAPSAFAVTNVNISGSGAFSYNGVTVNKTQTSIVTQKNKTVANTVVNANTTTGGNTSSFNTGGGSTVTAGPATTNVGVGVGGSSNTITPSLCGCATSGVTNVNVSGTGAFSVNGVVLNSNTTSVVSQSNTTIANTGVFTNTTSGGNSSAFNTGGTSSVVSGAATTNVGVVVTGSQNSQ